MEITSLEKFISEANTDQKIFEYLEYFSMAQCCSFRVGGLARAAVYPLSVNALKKLLGFLKENGMPFKVIGNGTNLIPSDNGFDGVLVITKKISELNIDGATLTAGCGVGLVKLTKIASDLSLKGMENLYGIPATVGGAVYMNAGAYNTQISDVLVSAECYNLKNDKIVVLENGDLNFSYRHSRCMDENLVVLSATFRLSVGDAQSIKDRMKEVMEKRKNSQPLEFPNAGSIFKRPQNSFAGKLIEDAGLKGLRVGGAEVSVKHAGFIINLGEATSSDICALIDIIKAKVLEHSGVMLQCEVEFI